MVVTLEDEIDVVLLENGQQGIPDVGVVMAFLAGEDRLVKTYDRPLVRIVGQGLFEEGDLRVEEELVAVEGDDPDAEQ